MNDDIRFYDFEFNLLYILPPCSSDIGYTSVNAAIEYDGDGAFELVFVSEELKGIIERYRDTILVVWRGFQGFLTSYRWDDKNTVTGMHLNGLLHRAVIPKTAEVTGTADSLARQALSEIDWLDLGKQASGAQVTYSTETYMTADKYIQDLLSLAGMGYRIRADTAAKKFIFECIARRENLLMLSESNLNAYGFEETYINKELAFGGWYEQEQAEDAQGNKPDPVWTYVTLDEAKSGIYKIDTVLSAKTETEAKNELAAKKAEYELLAKTRNITYGADYSLGDIVRVQHNGSTVRRLVSGVNMWRETEYGEEPILTDEEEEEENG